MWLCDLEGTNLRACFGCWGSFAAAQGTTISDDDDDDGDDDDEARQ